MSKITVTIEDELAEALLVLANDSAIKEMIKEPTAPLEAILQFGICGVVPMFAMRMSGAEDAERVASLGMALHGRVDKNSNAHVLNVSVEET